MQLITSREHPIIKQLTKLEKSRQYRKKNNMTLLDGIHLIQTHHAVLGSAENIIIGQSSSENQEIRYFLDKLIDKQNVSVISDSLFRQVSPVKTPTGILAIISIPKAIKTSIDQDDSFCVLLETIQDPGNLGSILRSAAAAGVKAVYLSDHCADAWSPKTLRAAMGAHFFLQIYENSDLITLARKFSGHVITTSLHAKKNLYDLSLAGPTAFVFGNEGIGLSPELLHVADENIVIPMPGKTESLNAAAAAAICFFEKVRQDQQAQRLD